MPMRSAPSQHVVAVCTDCERVTHHVRTVAYRKTATGQTKSRHLLVCLECKRTTKRKVA